MYHYFSTTRVSVFSIVLGFLIGFGSSAAIAAVVFSNYTNWSTTPYSYKGRTGVNPGSSVYAVAQVSKDGSGTVPAGYMGAASYLYKQTGLYETTLCKSAIVAYNTSATQLWNRYTSGSCGSGNYRASGFLYTYNSSTGLTEINPALNSPFQPGG